MPYLVFLLLGASAAALLSLRFLRVSSWPALGLAALVFWYSVTILPVHVLAALQIWGVTSSIDFVHLYILEASVFVCALAVAVPALRRVSLPVFAHAHSRQRLPWHVASGLGIVLCVYTVTFASLPFSFPDQWDGLSYHYPVALRWLQERTLAIHGSTPWQASLPGNAEVLELLVLSTGADRLLAMVHWPAAMMLLLGSILLGRRFASHNQAAWPIVTTVLMLPMVVNQAVSGYVDLFGTALVLASLLLVLEWRDHLNCEPRSDSPALLIAAGLACGLAIGAKPVFWPYCAVLFLNIVGVAGLSRATSNRQPWGPLALFAGAALLPSIFWFARAAHGTGNPLYPFAIRVGSVSLPGVYPSEITRADLFLNNVRHWSEWFVYPWTEWKRNPGFLLQNYTEDAGLGGAVATFVVPGVFYAVWLARKRRRELRIWLLNLGVLAVVWWSLLQKVTRFGLPPVVLACALSAPAFELLESRGRRLYRCIYVLTFAVTASILIVTPLHKIAGTLRAGNSSRAACYRYPTVLDTLPPGSRIATLCRETMNFPLAGSHLTNVVIPTWDSPSGITAAFLADKRVDFVVEEISHARTAGRVPVPPSPGLRLYHWEQIPTGDDVADWRVWQHSTLALSARTR